MTLEQIGKFQQPIYVTSDPANAERLLVAERQGARLQLRAILLGSVEIRSRKLEVARRSDRR